ncbi:MAG: MATE family efflux transporter, partial [Clostridia bacterium]|nr:MATE family efflux transporter [Clostridia bacterium]
LNIVFVLLLGMDVDGVAWATTISQVLSAVLVVRALILRQDACRLKLKAMRFYKEPMLKVLKIGVPAGIQASLFSISNVIIQSSVNSFGAIVVAGNSAAGTLEGFVYTTMNSFHQTALNFVGQNMGAKQYKRIHKILWICLACVLVVGAVCGGGFYLLGRPLLSIFISDSAAAIEYGMIRMAFICLPYFACGLMDVTTGAIRGMGVSVTPMVITILGVCGLRVGWIYTVFQLPAYHTLPCLYFSYIVSWTVTFVVELVAFYIIYRRKIRLHS